MDRLRAEGFPPARLVRKCAWVDIGLQVGKRGGVMYA